MVDRQELDRRIVTATNRVDRINALNDWAWYAWTENKSQAIKYAEEALLLSYETIAEGNPFWLGIANSLVNLSHLTYHSHEYRNASSMATDAWDIFHFVNNIEGQMKATYLLGLVYMATNRLEQAFDVLQEGYNLGQDGSNTIYRAFLLWGMGVVHVAMNNLEDALTYFIHARDIANTLNDPLMVADCLGYMCLVYYHKQQYEDALRTGSEAYATFDKHNGQYGKARVLNNLALVYIALGDEKTARKRLETNIILCDSMDHPIERCRAYKTLALLQMSHGNLVDARNNFNNALTAAVEARVTDFQTEIHQNLAEVFKRQGDFEQSLIHFEKFYELRNSVFEASKQKEQQNILLPYFLDIVKVEAEKFQSRSQSLHQQVEELKTVLQIYDEVSSNLKVDYVATISLDAAMRLSGAQAGFIAMTEGEDYFKIKTLVGKYEQYGDNRFILPHWLMGQLNKRTSLLYELKEPSLIGFPYFAGKHARIILPLLSNDTLIGIINIETNKSERFTNNVLQILEVLKGYIAIALDNAFLYERAERQLSELKVAHEKVSTLEQMKTDMIRLASHDLKNPLAVIKMYAQMLLMERETHDLNDLQRDFLRTIESNAGRMENIISDILSLERIEAMALSAVSQSVDLLELVQLIVDALGVQVMNKHQTVNFNTALERVVVLGDEVLLKEAVTNLVTNAIKYTPEGGTITINFVQNKDHVEFTVVDTGYGIPLDMQAKLFQPFYRARSDATMNIPGTGLGLHLVKNIVERHNGTLIFSSVYGQGSTFGFSLPLVEPNRSHTS